MKNVSWMVAFWVVLHAAVTDNHAEAQQRPAQDRRAVNGPLDLAGGNEHVELEELFEQLEAISEKIGHQLERWAEQNSGELEAWSKKYGHQWEEFGQRFNNNMKQLAADQQDAWNLWAQRYERNLERWSSTLEIEELGPENVKELVEQNLIMLKQMPVSQLVDQAIETGLNDFSDAPWESLDELGRLARIAIEQPLDELSGLSIDGPQAKKAIEMQARKMGQTLGRLKDDIGRNISDSYFQKTTEQANQPEDPRIRALKQLRQRNDATPVQIQQIDSMIEAIQADDNRSSGPAHPAKSRQGRVVEIPQHDQIVKNIEQKKQTQADRLKAFNHDLRRSSEEARNVERQEQEMKWKTKDARKSKRADGKDLDSTSRLQKGVKQNLQPRSRANPLPTKQKDQRLKKRGRQADSPLDAENQADPDEMKMLRLQIEQLRQELESLKKNRSSF